MSASRLFGDALPYESLGGSMTLSRSKKSFLKGIPIHFMGTVEEDDLNVYNDFAHNLRPYNIEDPYSQLLPVPENIIKDLSEQKALKPTKVCETSPIGLTVDYLNEFTKLKEEQEKKEMEAYQEGLKKVSGWRKLKSDFLGREEYYYQSLTYKMVALDVVTGEIRPVGYAEKKHIHDLNDLTTLWDTLNPVLSKQVDLNKDSKYEKAYIDVVLDKKIPRKSTFS